MLKKIPIHPIFLALYPTLALLGSNIEEVDLQVGRRPLLISVAAVFGLWCVFQLILRNWSKSALVISFLLMLFFSYGHVYGFFEANPISSFNLGRHRYLALLYGAILLAGLWWLIFRLKNANQTILPLNLFSLLVLIFPIIQIGGFEIRTVSQKQQVEELLITNEASLTPNQQPLPDIYYIVLDSHTRQDALLEDYQFDNSSYLEELRTLGFYIADCARSNYGYTQGSIVAALNMDYLENLNSYLSESDSGEDIWILLKNSRVRRLLEDLGYQTVAFDSGYEWSRLDDADIYLSLGNDSASMQQINPFEAMLVKSTALLLLTDTQNQMLRSRFSEIDFPYSFHVNSQLFILDQLPRLADDPQSQFIFVHLLIPHVPFVFNANGEVVADSAFYNGKKSWPSDDEHLRQGYVNEVAYIDQAMVDIFRTILAESNPPPIIVIMGDHGLRTENRYKILNAYYLPGDGSEKLYPGITPVNSFRVIFDTYFGSNYGITHDTSYTDEGEVVPETSPACLQP